jgi:hypothetical protein
LLVVREPNGRPTWVGHNIKKQPQNVVFLCYGEVHLMSRNGSDGKFSVRVTEAQLAIAERSDGRAYGARRVS